MCGLNRIFLFQTHALQSEQKYLQDFARSCVGDDAGEAFVWRSLVDAVSAKMRWGRGHLLGLLHVE